MASDKNSKLALGIFALALFASLLNPVHGLPYITFYQDLLVCMAGVAALTFFMAENNARTTSDDAPSPDPKIKLRFPALLAIPFGIIGMICLQIMLGKIELTGSVIIPVLYLLLCACALILGATLSLRSDGADKAITYVGSAYVLAALISVVLQQLQILDIDAMPLVMSMQKGTQIPMRPYANLAQPNQLALIYFFSLATVWYFYRTEKFPAWACALSAALILWGIVLTQSRIGWILIPVFYAYTLKDLIRSKHTGSLAITLLAAAYVVLNLLLPQLSQALGFAAGAAADHVGGRSERTVLWQIAWQLAAQHPWLGVGWYGYGAGQVNMAADFGPAIQVAHSHNLILNLAAELGWPAAIIITASLAWWFYQTCLKTPQTMAVQFFSLCFMAVGVHSMVEFPLWYAYVLLPVSMFMGMAHQMRWHRAGKDVYRNVALLGFIFSSLVAVFILLDYGRVVRGFKELVVIEMGYQPQEENLKKPALTIFPTYFEFFKLARIKPHDGMSPEEIAYIETWSKRFGTIPALSLLAEVYVLNGLPDKAIRTMTTMQRLHPIAYPKFHERWKAKAAQDQRYMVVFLSIPSGTEP